MALSFFQKCTKNKPELSVYMYFFLGSGHVNLVIRLSITKFVTNYVVIEESEYDDEEDSCWWCGNSAGVDTITFLNTYLIILSS